MPPIRKLLLLLMIFVPISFCGYKIGFFAFQLYLSRTPAQISDIPLYPGARDVQYVACTDRSRADCSTLTYSIVGSEAVVYDFYDDFFGGNSPLPKRAWVGDGTAYPEYRIINRYHDAPGRFQILTLSTLTRSTDVNVTIILSDKPSN